MSERTLRPEDADDGSNLEARLLRLRPFLDAFANDYAKDHLGMIDSAITRPYIVRRQTYHLDKTSEQYHLILGISTNIAIDAIDVEVTFYNTEEAGFIGNENGDDVTEIPSDSVSSLREYYLCLGEKYGIDPSSLLVNQTV